jgi:hypothetical protein
MNMTKLLEKALETVRRLPPDSQDQIALAMLSLSGKEGEPEKVDPAHLAAVLEGLAQANRHQFATDAEVEAAYVLAITRPRFRRIPCRPQSGQDPQRRGSPRRKAQLPRGYANTLHGTITTDDHHGRFDHVCGSPFIVLDLAPHGASTVLAGLADPSCQSSYR